MHSSVAGALSRLEHALLHGPVQARTTRINFLQRAGQHRALIFRRISRARTGGTIERDGKARFIFDGEV